jgi:prepilin-type N-terminal cleavage/methylation domain-containing protein
VSNEVAGSGRRSDPSDESRQVTAGRSRRTDRGFSLLELLVIVAIVGLLALLAAPLAGKIIRRAQDLGGYSAIRQALASARLQAVKRVANVVVLVSLTPEKEIHIHTFQDRSDNPANPLPADEQTAAANFVQDTTFLSAFTEPTLADVTIPSSVHLWKSGGTKDDLTDGISFDRYNGDATLVDRIVFLPSGGIAPPEDSSNSALPTTAGGRGIYFADSSGRNYFRVTIDSDLSGHMKVDKFVPGTGYTTTGWVWR